MSTTLKAVAAAAAAFAASALLNLSAADRLLSKPYDVGYLPTGRAARWASLGHRTFLSDLYWLSTVQYLGEPKADQRGWDKLFPLADLVTDLDPRHGYAYQTAGIVLSSVRRIDESDRIFLKGMEKAPRWTFPYYISFNHWFYLGDYETAARYARIAAAIPGASPNVSHLAVSLSSKSGTPEEAIELLGQLRAHVNDDVTAARLEEQMKLAILERDAQALERAAARYRAERGRDIRTVRELEVAGYVRAIPEDPFGGEYVWSQEDGRVHSSKNPFRFSVRDAPQVPSWQPNLVSPPSGVLR